MPPRFTDRPILSSLTPMALVLAAAAFMLTLTPSLVPRSGLLQGAVAGLSFALVYGLVAGLVALWLWLGMPDWRHPRLRYLAWAVTLAVLAYGLARVTGWQNAVRQAVEMPPVETARPLIIAATGLGVAGLLILLGRLFRRAAVIAANRLARLMPPRVAITLGTVIAAWLFWSIGNGVLLHGALKTMDAGYAAVDALIPPGDLPPSDPLKSGSAASLASWQSLGAAGRDRVQATPDAATIASLTGAAAVDPLRVYVGLNSADTPEARADLALAELIRIGAFDRQILVIATPTGTGWIDPASVAPLEILWGGDVASVSVQYSYLPSWLSLLVEPEYGHETARVVFARIYDHWRQMPAQTRPRLYLHGLSLGALNSDISLDFTTVIGDPPNGAFWAGPPFASRSWPRFTAGRDAGTPAWSPRFRDGALVRFTTQTNTTEVADAPWGPMRMIYLQYPSDAIAFFEPASFYRAPDWMAAPRGADVSPELNWVPVVTFVQLLTDMMTATTTNAGHGHVYAARHYLDGWVALTDPPGWDEAKLTRLRDWFTAQGL
ncbi:MAG: alpha/beta-hydrolase family protein [Paracoccaceae bacterium]